MESIVYVFINPEMPNLVKIGKTANLNRRLRDLSLPTGVPGRFECVYAVQTDSSEKAAKIEKLLFDAFSPHRRSNKEFFEVEPEQAASALRIAEVMGARKITPEGIEPTDQEPKNGQAKIPKAQSPGKGRKPAFRFDMVGLNVDAKLALIDSPHTSAIVTKTGAKGVQKIRCANMTTDESLSSAAQRVHNLPSTPCGPDYWIFDDPVHGKETLNVRRERMEKKG